MTPSTAVLPPQQADADRTLRETLFPDIDYANHPYYRGLPAPTRKESRQALAEHLDKFRGLLRTESELARYAEGHQRILAQKEHVPQAADMSARLARDGIAAVRIAPDDRAAMLDVTSDAIDLLDEKRQGLTPEQCGVGGVQTRVAHWEQPDERFEFFTGLLKRAGAFDACEQYYGFNFKLYAVTAQVNEGSDRGILKSCRFPDGKCSPLYYLHIDSTIGVMKVIIYRSEGVTGETGAFRFYPGSHSLLTPIERCIRKANDKAGFDSVKTDANRTRFMALPPEFRQKANFGNDLINVPERAERIVEHERVYESTDGDLILFDNNGMHRGAQFEEPTGRREILQLRLVPDLG